MNDYDDDDKLIYKIVRASMVLLVCVGTIAALLLLCGGACMIIDYILMT